MSLEIRNEKSLIASVAAIGKRSSSARAQVIAFTKADRHIAIPAVWLVTTPGRAYGREGN